MISTPLTIKYDPPVGTSISEACKNALALLYTSQSSSVVLFMFNDVLMEANYDDTIKTMELRWQAEMDRLSAEYRASAKYVEQKKRDIEKLAKHQQTMNNLIKELPNAVDNGLDAIVDWCGKFAEVSDYTGVLYNKPTVINTLKLAGYASDAFVGEGEAIKADIDKRGKWIVGQVLSGLSGELGLVHPYNTTICRRVY